MPSSAAALFGLALLAGVADSARLIRSGHDNLRNSLAEQEKEQGEQSAPSYGKSGCECIGLDWPNSTVEVDLGEDKVWYPRSMGSSCQAWDDSNHPDCEGKDSPAWCKKAWCFVDGCTCNLSTAPKTSSYLPEANSQGGKIYYSYATCGEEDEWTSKNHAKACVNQESEADCKKLDKCAWAGKKGCLGTELVKGCKAQDEKLFGASACKCIGFANISGTATVTIKEKEYEYPADFGSYCSKWDDKNHPSCKGDKPAAWCKQEWCYVDPCSCDLNVTPKKLTYVPGTSYQGKPLFYSYSACGTKDSYSSEENAKACPNFASESKCEKQSQCTWLSSKCVHKDLKEVCGTEKEGKEHKKEPEPEPEPEPKKEEHKDEHKGHSKSGAAALSRGLPALAAAWLLAGRF